jgi:hypothetical protein
VRLDEREMDGQRPEMRRTMTLSEQLSTPDPAIRDFLKIPQDDVEGGSPTARDADADGGMINWKPLRDRLRLRRAASAWLKPPAPKAVAPAHTASCGTNRSNNYNYSPGEAAAAFSRTPSLRTTPTFSRVGSTRVGNTSSRFSFQRPAVAYDLSHEDDHEEADHDGEEEEEQDTEEAPAAQMSLMALLEQSDSWDEDEEGGSEARKDGGGAVGDDEEDDGEGQEEEMVHVCCVCMVRHKGAAFIPCGHTFCRLCSRELWVSRGNCPLCNGFIQEILDIF